MNRVKRVVITGPTGAIGMALIEKCIKNQTEVLAICHPDSKRNIRIPHSSYVRKIETDLFGTQEAVRQITDKYDVFFHFAWAGTTGEERNNVRLQCRNIEATVEAVELAAWLGCHTFIGAGSQAEYGRVEGLLRPDTPAFPENGYGMAKLCAGQMSRLSCKNLGLRHIWVRILSVYGPYDGENSMISGTLNRLLAGEHAGFTLGEQMWDYLYSEDAAEAMYLLAQRGVTEKTYVLGSGQVQPLKEYIKELYQAVMEVEEHSGSIGLGDYPYAEKQVMYLGADISELNADTGFLPQISFREGIRETLKYMWKKE